MDSVAEVLVVLGGDDPCDRTYRGHMGTVTASALSTQRSSRPITERCSSGSFSGAQTARWV